ncbi:MAG: T9SS C-terminal target domain-containing protein [Bacteroidetes bacterium]|nr:MAG: T9SS C-terminal target domain-containing protein [Bacteroidota bacterium]
MLLNDHSKEPHTAGLWTCPRPDSFLLMKYVRLTAFFGVLMLHLMMLPAQSPSRSGAPAPSENLHSLRRFPCGGVVLLDETFNGRSTLPAGWQVRDVDQLTPRNEILPLTPTGGWQLAPDFKDSSNSNKAFISPSWYADTVGQSDDWLILPQIQNLPSNVCLSWYAYSQDQFYQESYEVRVSTSGTEPADFFQNSTLVSVTAEDFDFTYRTTSLAAYAGQNVYVAFRHTSKDKFILVLDDIRMAQTEDSDLAMFTLGDITTEAGKGVKFSGSVLNRGLKSFQFDSAQMKISYQINAEAIKTIPIKKKFTLLANDTIQFRHDSIWIPAVDAVYKIKVWVSGQTKDDLRANDTIARWLGTGPFTSADPETEAALSLYPNPAADEATLTREGISGTLSVRIFDLAGRNMIPPRSWPQTEAELHFDLAQLPKGLFLVQISGEQGQIRSLRLVKQ